MLKKSIIYIFIIIVMTALIYKYVIADYVIINSNNYNSEEVSMKIENTHDYADSEYKWSVRGIELLFLLISLSYSLMFFLKNHIADKILIINIIKYEPVKKKNIIFLSAVFIVLSIYYGVSDFPQSSSYFISGSFAVLALVLSSFITFNKIYESVGSKNMATLALLFIMILSLTGVIYDNALFTSPYLFHKIFHVSTFNLMDIFASILLIIFSLSVITSLNFRDNEA